MSTQAGVLQAQTVPRQLRTIPSSGEQIPAVGLGTWITFNVGQVQDLLDSSTAVVKAFFEAGGRMIDSSPMYGSAQTTVGYALSKLGKPDQLFSAEKVWTTSGNNGPAQIEETRRRWQVPQFDLLQIHNLVAWEAHLETLARMKADKQLRYVGLTTSHGLRHAQVEHILSNHAIDFVQLTYNVVDRDAERRLLPLARERGVAVIVNRPFRQGALVRRLERHPLPAWVAETGATTWAQFLLKFIISHPAVTCAIPATTRVDHVRENMAAAQGAPLSEPLRKRMLAYVAHL
ncbi:MAG: aldo/keto reductase [Pseudomonadota bacterium]